SSGRAPPSTRCRRRHPSTTRSATSTSTRTTSSTRISCGRGSSRRANCRAPRSDLPGYSGACDKEAWGMDESSGISEDAPYRDPKVPKRLVPLAHQSIRLHLLPGERVLGMFSSMRMRRSITLLVVTDVRLLTLGDEHVGLPVVDEVLRADV